jgi:hypothetical protein
MPNPIFDSSTAIGQEPPGDDDTLLTTAATAAWLIKSPQWLELGRCRTRGRTGYGPAYIKTSKRCVRYRKRDVKDYLRSRRVAAEVT